jgi:hypothetical protein
MSNDLIFVAKNDKYKGIYFSCIPSDLSLEITLKNDKGFQGKTIHTLMDIQDLIELFYFINQKFIGLNISMEDIRKQLNYD